MIKSLVKVVVLWACALAALAAPVITTGGTTGNYYQSFGPNLAKTMATYQEFRGPNFPQVVESQGGLENMSRIAAGEAQLGIVPPDAYMYFRATSPNEANRLVIVGALPIDECIYMVVSKDSPVNGLSKLNKDTTVNIGVPGSGTQASWAYMSKLQKGLSEVPTESQSNIMALGQIQNGGYAAMFFQTTINNPSNEIITAVVAEGSGLEFAELDNSKLAGKLPNGKEVYTIKNSIVDKSGWTNDTVDVPCMQPLVIGSVDNPPALNEAAARAILLKGNNVVKLNN